MNVKAILDTLKPGFDSTPLVEKFRSATAALIGILVLGWLLHVLPGVGYPFGLLASMAAAAVLLYAVPHSPMAQPWPLLVGNVLSGAIGWWSSILIHDLAVAAACAVGISILVMHLTRSLHPPGAATAIVMVLNASQFQQHGWLWVACMVLVNILLSLLLAVIINNLIHIGRYPVRRHHAPVKPAVGPTLAEADVEWALQQMEGVTDVSEEDLLEIFRLACEHAHSKNKA